MRPEAGGGLRIHGVTKSQTGVSGFTFPRRRDHSHFYGRVPTPDLMKTALWMGSTGSSLGLGERPRAEVGLPGSCRTPQPRAPGPLPTRQLRQLWSGLLLVLWQLGKTGRFPSAQTWFPIRLTHHAPRGDPGAHRAPGTCPESRKKSTGGRKETRTHLNLSFSRAACSFQADMARSSSQSGISSHLTPTRGPDAGPAGPPGRCLPRRLHVPPGLGGLARTCTCPLSRLLAGSSHSFQAQTPSGVMRQRPNQEGDCFHAKVSVKSFE